MNPLKALKVGGAWVVDSLANATGCRLYVERLPHPKSPTSNSLRIPGYKQLQSYTCGFTSAANVLHLFQPDAPLERLFNDLDSLDRSGVNEIQETNALRRYGLGVRKRSTLDLEQITQAIDDGKPIIAEVNLHGSDHYVVIYGYDLDRETVYVCGNGDLPVLNRKKIPYSRFLKIWEPVGNGLICSPGKPKKPPNPRNKRPVRKC